MNADSEVAMLAGHIAARINADSGTLAAQWNHPQGTPTRHFVVDDLLPQDDVARIYASFPRSGTAWFQRDSFRERKKTFAKLNTIEPLIGHITDAFHTPEVLQAVKAVTAIEGLEADPELYAG